MQNLTYNLVQTNLIVSQLTCLFDNLPSACLKQNQSGWGSNQRILFVKNNKLMYARMYQEFREGYTKQIPQRYIKGIVNLVDIYEVTYLPKDKPQKKSIKITIPENKISYEINELDVLDILEHELDHHGGNVKAKQKQKQSQQQSVYLQQQGQQKQKLKKWTFHFQYDLKKKLAEQRQRQRQEQRQKNQLSLEQGNVRQQQKRNQQLAQNQSESNNHSKLFLEDTQQIALEQYVSQLKKAKDYLKFKQNKQKQQKNQRRKNKTRQTTYQQYNNPFNNQQKNFPIMTHWRQYFLTLQDLNQRHKKKQQRSIHQYELMVYKQVHSFKQTCSKIFKNYILQKINGINGQKWQFEKFYFYKGIWIKLGGKQLNQQFLMYYYVSDLACIFNRTSKIIYKVPDVCLVDYLGYKGLCMCDLPFSEIQKSEVYNMNSDIYDMHNTQRIKESLAYFQKVLNLKAEQMQKERKRLPAPMGQNIRIFQYHPKRDLKADQSLLQNFFYMANIQSLFPLDYNYQLNEPRMDCKLRPQHINDARALLQIDYDNTQLLSTAFMQSSMSQQQKTRQDDKVVKASKSILREKIPQFAQMLNNCQLIIVDSYSLKMYMGQFGINMRYLYKIYQLVSIKYLRQVIQIQCLSRTVKKLFYQSLKQLAQNQLKEKLYHDKLKQQQDQQYDPELQNMDYINQQNQQKFVQDQLKFDANAMDFLNLIFGRGEESVMFWKILLRETEGYFQIKVPFPFQGSAGYLLHAILYNCGIQAIFDLDIPLFKVKQPFTAANQIRIRVKCKGYEFPSFQIQKMIKGIPSIQTTVQHQAQLFQKIALKLYKMDLLKNYYLYQNDFNYHSSFAKINLVKQQMNKPTYSNSHHPSQITYYIANKSQTNFQKGLNLLNFVYSDFHPMYVSFYEQYSKVYQPQLLKKTAILQSIKCFGQFHAKTTEIYSYTHKEGYKQFFKKALRSQSVLVSNTNMRGQYQKRMFYSCMQYALKQMKMLEQQENRVKKQNCQEYIDMLFMGMRAATKIRYLQESILISENISDLLNKFKLRNYVYHYQLIQQILKVKMIMTPQKLFLYKMTVLCITIQKKFKQHQNTDRFGYVLPAVGQQKQTLATGIMNQYFVHQTHSLWLANIFKHLLSSIQYFNHLQDLFTNIQYHLSRYDNIYFKESLGYWDILIRLYGEKVFKDFLYQTGNI